MARNFYQYGTSPRKIEPEYVPVRKKQVTKKNKQQKGIVTKTSDQKRKQAVTAKEQKNKKVKQIATVLVLFTILLAISYRNSLINEEFSEIKDLKNSLATIKKENGQITKSIEENLNKENIEKVAAEELGMQKKTKEQTVEITIEKSDYIETTIQDIEEKEESFFEKIINEIF